MFKEVLAEKENRITFIEELKKILKSYNLIINISENLDTICVYENDVVPLPAIREVEELVLKKWKLKYDVKVFAKNNQVCFKISKN
jgi:hypothetical protein